jgi:hypothetical protein
VLEPSAELIVGWRPKPDHLDAGSVTLHTEMAQSLRELAASALLRLPSLERRLYRCAPYIEPGEQYLAVPTTSLTPASEPRGAVSGPDAEEAHILSELLRIVTTAPPSPLSKTDLRDGRYLFYAVVCRNQVTAERIGFVRQIDPHKVARAGGVMAIFGDEGLQELTNPLFVFESTFDLIVSPDETVVLRLEAFNRLFADIGMVLQAGPANAQRVCEAVGNIDDATVAALAAAAGAKRSIARRLQRLTRPGALPQVTPTALRKAMRKHGLDPAILVRGNTIVFTDSHAATFVDLLEQLYYETDFTGEHRRADRYSLL